MFMDQAESLISEYAGSEHFMFLDPKAKENVEPVLMAFFRKAAESGLPSLDALKAKDVEAVLLTGMPHLDLPADLKRVVPEQLEAFFAFLKESGRFPPAGAWRMCVEANRKRYLDSLRADGSVKGTTFKKQYTDVGRNDPCPCGSGKKFKKCCMELIQ
jgi:SEC-C motif